jgi:DNA repair exonuclease SbcCD nuclease subunit
LLSGDVADPCRCGPRELLFLVEQFERLNRERISVYWASGPKDSSDNWPEFVKWPSNVRRFSRSLPQRHLHEASGDALCEIIGRAFDPRAIDKTDDYGTVPDLFSIAAEFSPNFNSSNLAGAGINYWALGGSRERMTPLTGSRTVHYPGSPLGRRPSETGAHGCTLVQVDEDRGVKLAFIDCDTVRWHCSPVSVADSAEAPELERQLQMRASELYQQMRAVTALVSWQITCSGKLHAALRHGSLAPELTTKLRGEFGNRTPSLWTIDIVARRPAQLPGGWYEEQTLRGDFLRTCRDVLSEQLEHRDEFKLCDDVNLLAAIGDESCGDSNDLLEEVMWLGADLLSPEEIAS